MNAARRDGQRRQDEFFAALNQLRRKARSIRAGLHAQRDPPHVASSWANITSRCSSYSAAKIDQVARSAC